MTAVAASWCDPAGGTPTQAVALVASVAIIDPSGAQIWDHPLSCCSASITALFYTLNLVVGSMIVRNAEEPGSP